MLSHLLNGEIDSWEIRKKILHALHAVGGGHYGGAFSVVDILQVLYNKILQPRIGFFGNPFRDRLILSKGHAAMALYCTLAALKIIDESQLYKFGVFMSGIEGHPDMLETTGIDFSTGSLGQGLSVGLGMAIGLRSKSNAHVWVILGDGECQEGQIWEAAMLASRYKVNNLHVVIDANGAQEYGYQHNQLLQQMPLPNLREKWESFSWKVLEVNGHCIEKLDKSFKEIRDEVFLPSVVIARTKKGYGVSQFENNPENSHWANLTEAEFKQAIQELNDHAR